MQDAVLFIIIKMPKAKERKKSNNLASEDNMQNTGYTRCVVVGICTHTKKRNEIQDRHVSPQKPRTKTKDRKKKNPLGILLLRHCPPIN